MQSERDFQLLLPSCERKMRKVLLQSNSEIIKQVVRDRNSKDGLVYKVCCIRRYEIKLKEWSKLVNSDYTRKDVEEEWKVFHKVILSRAKEMCRLEMIKYSRRQ